MVKMTESGGNCTSHDLVLLLKTPPKGDDHYHQILSAAGFQVSIISVLSFKFLNIAELSHCLADVAQLSGLVLTSPRTVEAVAKATKNLTSQDWKHLPCYVVGNATGKDARAIGLSPIGEDAGNADSLAELVIAEMDRSSKPLLFPCSSMRRDTLLKRLGDIGIAVRELTVYETVADDGIGRNLKALIESQRIPDFVVFYSPSGVQYIWPFFKDDTLPLQKMKVIAIGSTTQQELMNKGIHVAGMCAKPNPESLLQALKDVRHNKNEAGQ